jgi:hypothetical protein
VSGGGTSALVTATASNTKRPKTEEESDAYALLERGTLTRKCPACDKAVPDSGSFYLLHLAQCDVAAWTHVMQGDVPLPPAVSAGGRGEERLTAVAQEEARARLARSAALAGQLLEPKQWSGEELVRHVQFL